MNGKLWVCTMDLTSSEWKQKLSETYLRIEDIDGHNAIIISLESDGSFRIEGRDAFVLKPKAANAIVLKSLTNAGVMAEMKAKKEKHNGD